MRGGGERIEIARTIASREQSPRIEILNRKTKWVKFKRDIIIRNKFSNGDEIFDNMRGI